MINAIKRLFGVHVHEWGVYGDPVSTNYERQEVIYEDRLVGYDDDDDPVYEEFDTGQTRLVEWTETYQSRTCSSCGELQRRRIR
jgi:hypothetical protein